MNEDLNFARSILDETARKMGQSMGEASGAVVQALAGVVSYLNQIVTPAFGNLASGIVEANQPLFMLALRTTALTSAMYGATQAFQSFVPTMTNVTRSIQQLLNLGALVPGVGLPLRALGISLGKFESVMQFQLEGSQKVADSLMQLSSVGITFGASMNNFADNVAGIRIPMQMLAKVVQANVEQISKLGLSQEQNLRLFAATASDIFYGLGTGSLKQLNDTVTALYGNYENLSEATLGYLNLVKLQGADLSNRAYIEGLVNGEMQTYLIRLKEQSALTGKQVKQLQAEEAERRTNLAYQLKVGQLGEEAAQNFAELERFSSVLGPEMKQIARSLFAGQELTPELRQIAALNQPAVEMIQQMVNAAQGMGKVDFRNQASEIMKTYAPQIAQFANNMSDLSKLPPGANRAVDTLVRIASLGLASYTDMIGAGRSFRAISESTADATQGLDQGTKVYIDSMRTMMQNQVEIDMSITDNMSKMSGLINMLSALQSAVLRFQTAMTGIILTRLQAVPNPAEGGLDEAATIRAFSDALQDVIAGLTSRTVDLSADTFYSNMRARQDRLNARLNAMEQGPRPGAPAAALPRPEPRPTAVPAPPEARPSPGATAAGQTTTIGPTVPAPTTPAGAAGPVPVSLSESPMPVAIREIDFQPLLIANNDTKEAIEALIRVNRDILNAVS